METLSSSKGPQVFTPQTVYREVSFDLILLKEFFSSDGQKEVSLQKLLAVLLIESLGFTARKPN